MEQTLAANSNAVVAIEYAPDSISELGFEPKKLLNFFQDKNYFMYLLGRRGNLKPMQDEAIEKMVNQRGYIDLICSKKKLVV
jgi:hypothetical protein